MMRSFAFLCLIVAALFSSSVVVVARKSSGSGSSDASPSKLATFLPRVKASSHNLIQLKDSREFSALTSTPRDFSVSALLTAVDSGVPCQPCLNFQPHYEAVARSWRKVKGGDKRHLFSQLEFKDGREIFQQLGLSYAPVLLYFPPTSGEHAKGTGAEPEQYDFNRLGFDGADVAAELSKQLGVDVPYRAPFPWKFALTATLVAVTLTTLLIVVLPRLSSAQLNLSGIFGVLIQLVTLSTITVMCAGHMWNGIRNAPYMMMGQNGKPEYFAGGFQNQYGAETQIVSIIYGLLAFATVSLTILVPKQRDPVRQRAGVYIWSAILLGTFSLLFYVFRIKNPSYPFRLFL